MVSEYQFNSQEVCILNLHYLSNSLLLHKELVLKLQSNNIRTKAFTQQLIVLAKQFGTLTHKNYTNHAKDYIKQGF